VSASVQLQASDPASSAFVSAHAGSGKTKVLVDRLLRLMLAGADPARILCLTYTKAAAAEMAIRLQKQLGKWVTLSDTDLARELWKLNVPQDAAPLARALFAKVLDLPGGMRISTIHAFCQSLLKRFPLEAQISPHFQVVEEVDRRAELEAAREAALPEADETALALLAALTNAEGFASLVSTLEAARDKLAHTTHLTSDLLLAALRRAARITSEDEAALRQAATASPAEQTLAAALRLAARHGSTATRERAERALLWLSLTPDLRQEHLQEWVEEFLRPDGEPRGLSVFANKKLADQHPHIIPLCQQEQTRLLAFLDEQRAHRMAAASAALLGLAAPILARYTEAKSQRGLLDYGDLIARSTKLLKNAEIGAAWVLYKLDSGLDHLLLDEVQDTAPEQWDIADRLTADFFTGDGACENAPLPRTIFAVGDRKQSIYSFQGAVPEKFDEWRRKFASRVQAAGQTWRAPQLETSFRSTAPVLALVDAVFADSAAANGVREPAETIRHTPHRIGQAGRVDLWPLAPRPEAPAHTPWTIPTENQSSVSAPQTLINELAAWIASETSGAVRLDSEDRPLRPGDVLVLVRRRSHFAGALVRALKSRGVPVAGLDRIALTEQPAVRDLVSLCEALLLPQDDLAFAEMLVSPLGGLTDDSLMQLAIGRAGSLRAALSARASERPDWRAAEDFYARLLARVDYAPPHALLSEALGPLGGRARLFARLGPEAAEPVDEFLDTALNYATTHPPSLQGFVHWLTLAAAEVKREPEAAGDSVRVMTVHGAKGLEAPLVILPDTTSLPPDEPGLCWAEDVKLGAQLPLWSPNKALRCAAIETLRQARSDKALREYNRLLYVALTRARDRLLICGWETARPQVGNWYEKVASAMPALGAEPAPFNAWPGQALRFGTPQTAMPEPRQDQAAALKARLPAWAGQATQWQPAPLPPEPPLPRPLAPSRPEGVEFGPVPPSRSPLAARLARDRFARGLAVHALLQHLPDLPDDARKAAAERFAAHPALKLESPSGVVRAALAVLAVQELSALFSPGSRAEQPISGLVADHIVTGQVDRLAILPDRVLIADYKTGLPPADIDHTPLRYLRQMAAYRAVLMRLYPGRDVRCVLIWTDGPRIAVLPQPLLDRYAPGAAGFEAA
jgi:ATP-dependent helicase/nuclease subunit A